MSRRIILSVILVILVIASFVLSACGKPAPATQAAPTPTATTLPTETPTPVMTTAHETEATFSAMGFGRLPWGITLAGDNKVCFADLRSNPRICDGNTLKITAKTPLLVIRNGEVLATLKVNDVVTLNFSRDTSYDFYGLADRTYPFAGEWRSQMFMWSDITKTYPVLLMPRKDGHDIFIDLAEGVTYDLTADANIFNYEVTSPTMGYLFCQMGETCVFNP